MTDQPTESTTTEQQPENILMVTTLVSGASFEGRVQIEGPTVKLQFSVEEARAFALNVLEASTYAEADAFLFHFVLEKISAGPEAAAQLLREFREYRQARIAKPPEGVELVLGPDQEAPGAAPA